MKNNTIQNIRQLNENNNNNYKTYYDEILINMNKINKIYNCSLSIVEFNHKDAKKSKLNGIFYSLKDNIATKHTKTTGGSLFLSDYVPSYNAHVKDLLDQAGAICISKDNLDEFGLGGTGTYSAYGMVVNAFDNKRIAGGSSSGSSVMVAKNIVPFAIATDTGDSIRKPASFQGIVGFKPTYGAISRYGVFPYSPSLDHVGILANNVNDVAMVFEVICEKDNKDMTSIDLKNEYHNLLINSKKKFNDYKVAFLKDVFQEMHSGEKEEFGKYINHLKKKIKIDDINFGMDMLKLIDPIYKSISYGESTSCWSNLSGILFGNHIDGSNFNEIANKSRTKYFGKQLKRRFVIGSFITSKENFEELFLKAKKIRKLIVDRINNLLNQYDFLLIPGASSIAPLVEDVLHSKTDRDICSDALQIANFAGLPSITLPAIKYSNMPLGINITGGYKKDLDVLLFAQLLENLGETNE